MVGTFHSFCMCFASMLHLWSFKKTCWWECAYSVCTGSSPLLESERLGVLGFRTHDLRVRVRVRVTNSVKPTYCSRYSSLSIDQVQSWAASVSPQAVASPEYTRPESDVWLCSVRLGVLDGNVSSRSLYRAFGWNRPIPGPILAAQLVALSKKFEVSGIVLLLMLRGVTFLVWDNARAVFRFDRARIRPWSVRGFVITS